MATHTTISRSSNALNIPKVRRSHVVPKFYLRGFCEPGTERVWVGDIRTLRTYQAHIAKIGVVKDFYAAKSGDHEDDLELRLSGIESDAAPELRKLVSGNWKSLQTCGNLSLG